MYFKHKTLSKKVNRKVQEVSQSQIAANSWHQEEEKKDKNLHVQNKQTNAQEAHRPAPSSSSEMITMLKGIKKQEKTEQGRLKIMKRPVV